MTKEELKRRTREFAIDCWNLTEKLPVNRGFDAYCRQLIRCSSPVGANYRAACRAKSDKYFINKLEIVEEADESRYFLETFEIISQKENNEIKRLQAEANELVAITIASIKTMRNRRS